jgi:two-component system sensor kinase FixL
MAVAACLTLAMIHLQIAMRMDGRPLMAHVFFALSAVSVAATGVIELSLLLTEDLPRYQALMRGAELPIWLMIVSLTGFVWCFFGTGRRWLALLVAGLMTVVTLINFLVPDPLSIRYATAIRTVETFGGVRICLGSMRNGLLTVGEMASVGLLMLFVTDASIALWRNGHRRRAAVVGGSILFFALTSRAYAALVETGVLSTPFFFIFPFLALLAAMGRELSLDVHRSVELAYRLSDSEQRMVHVTKAAQLGLWLWDAGTDTIWVNDELRLLFGFAPEQRLGFRQFMSAMHPEDREPVQRAVQESAATGAEFDRQYRVRHPDGQIRWIESRGRAEFGRDGRPLRVLGVARDVTARRETELALQHGRNEIAHLSRVAMLGELSGSLAHELNQPLAAILFNAQAAKRFLAEGHADLNELNEILQDIVEADVRAGEVIHRLRLLLKKGEVQLQNLNTAEVLHDVLKLVRNDLLNHNIQLSVDLARELPPVFGDRIQLQQVMLNLLLNACDAMEQVAPGHRQLVVRAAPTTGGGVRVSVSDRGPGLAPSVATRIFEPFFSTKAHGLGLGLSVCMTIITAHRGQLWAENNPDRGATFHFELPAATAA